MHELGIVMGLVDTVKRIFKEQNLTEIASITLQIGELSSVVPGFLRQCYPAAVDGTVMEQTKLIIETIQGNVMCCKCGKVYRFLEHNKGCPNCGDIEKEILCGNEFIIKEIEAR